MELRQKLRQDLRDREYRHAYADESLDIYIASQIRTLRDQRDLRQSKLADLIGTKQAGISRLESGNYSGWTISTLKKLAEAFDVRLHVSFESFGSLWREIQSCDRWHLQRPKFEDDPEFQGHAGHSATESTAVTKQLAGEVPLPEKVVSIARSDRIRAQRIRSREPKARDVRWLPPTEPQFGQIAVGG